MAEAEDDLTICPDVLAVRERYEAFGFHMGYYDRWVRLARRYHSWLRVETSGLENIPSEGPALLVCNHAGLRIYDMMCFQAALRLDHAAKRTVRGLGHVGTEKIPVWGRILHQYAGMVLGHHRNAEYLLDRGELVGVTPEGGHSTAKRFSERDQVCGPDHWGSGWLKLALRSGAPVILVASSGFESAVPTIRLSRILGRFWGMDDGVFPIAPQSLPTLFHPALAWTMPFPVKCMIDISPPVDLAAIASGPILTDADLRELSLRIRSVLNQRVTELSVRRRRSRRRVAERLLALPLRWWRGACCFGTAV